MQFDRPVRRVSKIEDYEEGSYTAAGQSLPQLENGPMTAEISKTYELIVLKRIPYKASVEDAWCNRDPSQLSRR